MDLFFGEDVAASVLRLIDGAQKKLVLVSPFFAPWTRLTTMIENAIVVRRVGVTLVLRGGKGRDVREQAAARFASHGARVLYVENLHAKLYLNEAEAIVSSLNLLESSALNSWEIAQRFQSRTDRQGFDEVVKAWKRLEQLAESERVREEATLADWGYCIADCGERIPFNPKRPFCRECWEEDEEEGTICHSCGVPWRTTRDKSRCKPCFVASPT